LESREESPAAGSPPATVKRTQGITADESALALFAAKALCGLKTRDVAALTLRRLAEGHGLAAIAVTLGQAAANF
jgi:hypothetical protein